MKHRYDIAGILQSIVGYRGLPFPGAFLPSGREKGYKAEDFEVSTYAPYQKQYINGTRLYAQDALGRWYFMPVTLKYPGGEYELPNAILTVTGKKNIVETQLVGRKGSVKELISIDDYKVSIAAFIQSADGRYPDAEIARIDKIYNISQSIELVSAFTDILFKDEKRIVINSVSYPPLQGVEDAFAVKMECETDEPFQLIIE